MFEDFVEQLLEHCGRLPEPNSVLVMDNTSFQPHRKDKRSMLECWSQAVILTTVFGRSEPIEEFFAEPKAFISVFCHPWTDIKTTSWDMLHYTRGRKDTCASV